jgi:CheY-like chemotaxis protein
MISVLLCDDHAVVRYGIAAVLDAYGEFRLLGAVGSAAEALRRALRQAQGERGFGDWVFAQPFNAGCNRSILVATLPCSAPPFNPCCNPSMLATTVHGEPVEKSVRGEPVEKSVRGEPVEKSVHGEPVEPRADTDRATQSHRPAAAR